MTVSSLWKVLDKAGCGEHVGERHLASPRFSNAAPLNSNDKTPPKTLAVDLSIWICESLASFGTNDQNTNPALYLVFTRTMKLLNLGVRLVFVVEGKRRVYNGTGDDKFHKRRSGTKFWKACNDCEQLLKLLGVPVVRAKYEAEALCALLSHRGIVDGVISNDGDCLLFGAKVVYTKYSNENLNNGNIVRYSLDNLHARVEPTNESPLGDQLETMKLSRHDLVSFAILTGSDIVGSGMEQVGHKKAIRFIKKCQSDNPLTKETAAWNEMSSWAKAAKAGCTVFDNGDAAKSKTCCSRCNHPGTKRSHEKHGCAICGTEPGEPCFQVTAEDRFRKFLREKALALTPKFDPSRVLAAYMRPNDNQVPKQFVNGGRLRMSSPKVWDLMKTRLIVKGRSLEESRRFVRQAVLRHLSHRELYRNDEEPGGDEDDLVARPNSREKPVPKQILKALTKNQVPCYEILWIVNGTATDEAGEAVDGFEFATVEPCSVVQSKYPEIFEEFQKRQQELAKQGDGMQTKRRDFLQSLVRNERDADQNDEKVKPKKRIGAKAKRRGEFFQNQPLELDYRQSSKRRRQLLKGNKKSDDVGNLLRFACKNIPLSPAKTLVQQKKCGPNQQSTTPAKPRGRNLKPIPEDKPVEGQETPQSAIVCHMGDWDIKITPLESQRGLYPPRHIFVHRST